MPETMNHDAYLLDDDNHDGNDEQLAGLKERLQAYRDAAGQVLTAWEDGDLAHAVRTLAALTESVTELPDGFHEDKAQRLGFQLTQTGHGERWVLDDSDGPGHETAKEAVGSMEQPAVITRSNSQHAPLR